MYTLLAFIAIFGGVVFIHELGHFLAARSVGVRVEKFYVGFDFFGLGMKLYEKNGTEYGIGLFPFGGYCKIAGMIDESLDNKMTDENDGYESKGLIAKLWIDSAGVIMNFILAILLYFITFSFYGIPDKKPIINNIVQDSPVHKAGITEGSTILAINGKTVDTWTDIQKYLNHFNINNKEIQPVSIKYMDFNSSNIQEVELIPDRKNIENIKYFYPFWITYYKNIGAIYYESDSGPIIELIDIGIEPPTTSYFLTTIDKVEEGSPAYYANIPAKSSITKIDNVKINKWEDISNLLSTYNNNQLINIEYQFEGHLEQINLNLKDGKIGITPKSEMIPENIVWNEMSFSESIVKSFKAPIELISIQIWFFGQIIDGKEGFDSVGGPVKITQAAGQAAQAGLPYFLEFMALISTMLGFMNILPIPALDGGHALIAIIESIFRRKIPVKVKMAIQSVAVLLLLTLMAFVLFNDIGDLIN